MIGWLGTMEDTFHWSRWRLPDSWLVDITHPQCITNDWMGDFWYFFIYKRCTLCTERFLKTKTIEIFIIGDKASKFMRLAFKLERTIWLAGNDVMVIFPIWRAAEQSIVMRKAERKFWYFNQGTESKGSKLRKLGKSTLH